MNENLQLPADFHLKERRDTLSGKTLLTIRHISGLTLKVLPFPGFTRQFAALTVPCGAIHTRFKLGENTIAVPAGTAHFLEHCVFSRDEEGGLSGRLSSLGASANAYTTYDHTLYYFATATSFTEALQVWLDALIKPRLDEQRVEMERPIILAELDQYLDDPDTRCTQLMMENLYAAHPVREDIGGTAASVQAIRAEDLVALWSAWYQPAALTLTLAGDIELNPLLEDLARRLALPGAGAPHLLPEPLFPEEQRWPLSSQQYQQMDVAAPLFLTGIKNTAMPANMKNGMERALYQRTARLVLDTLLSAVSPLYDQLYHEGLLNDSFSYHLADDTSFSFIACGGESERPAEAAEKLQAGLIASCRKGLDTTIFEAQKRAAAGDIVRMLDSVEQAGLAQARSNLLGLDLFDYPAIYDKIDVRQAMQLMTCLCDPRCYTTAIIESRR